MGIQISKLFLLKQLLQEQECWCQLIQKNFMFVMFPCSLLLSVSSFLVPLLCLCFGFYSQAFFKLIVMTQMSTVGIDNAY